MLLMGKGSEDDGNWTVTLLWSLVALVVGAIFALVMVAAIACSGKGKKRKGSARETSAAAQRADSRCLLARLLASTHHSKASLLQLQATLDGAEFFPSGFGDDEKTKAMKALLNNSSCTSLTYYLSLVLPSASLSLSVRRALFLGT